MRFTISVSQGAHQFLNKNIIGLGGKSLRPAEAMPAGEGIGTIHGL
jgi:hypothetical protein